MDKDQAIYGLAMPFDDSYWEYDKWTDTITYERTNRNAVVFDTIVGATIDHDYSRTLGDIRDNLIVRANEYGVVFKLIPNCPEGFSAYKKVKRGALKHCSVSYLVRQSATDTEEERRAAKKFKELGWKEKVKVKRYKKVLLFEICLTNEPANASTFCTTDKNHPMLKGIDWNTPLPEKVF